MAGQKAAKGNIVRNKRKYTVKTGGNPGKEKKLSDIPPIKRAVRKPKKTGYFSSTTQKPKKTKKG